MKAATEIKTITFHVNHEPGFYVDIVQDKAEFHAWLYHEDIGIKEYMFGFPRKDCKSKQEFIEIVEANLDNRCYTLDYKDEYMKEG